MSKIMEFAFRIEKGANLAYDTETGEACACYSKIKISNCRDNISEKEYQDVHEELRSKSGLPLEYTTPISMDEYIRKAGAGDDDDDDAEYEAIAINNLTGVEEDMPCNICKGNTLVKELKFRAEGAFCSTCIRLCEQCRVELAYKLEITKIRENCESGDMDNEQS